MLILDRLRLRTRIQFGFAASGVLAVVLVALSFSNLYRLYADFKRLSNFSNDMQHGLIMAQEIVRLQSVAELYMHDGHQAAMREVQFSYARAQAEMEILRDSRNPVISQRLQRIDDHLQTFYEVFGQARRQKEAQAQLVDSGIRALGAALQTQIQRLQDGDAGLEAARAVQRAELPLKLLQIETNAYRYFDGLDVDYMREARRLLLGVQVMLANLADELAGSDDAHRFNAVQQDVERYGAAIIEAQQRTRGYYFLSHVVLAGEAYEMLYQAEQLSSAVAAEMAQIDYEVSRAIANGIRLTVGLSLGLLMLMLLFSFAIGRSIAAPITELAATFRRLAGGEDHAPIRPQPMGGELEELAHAAEVFRQKNAETRQLLLRSQQMSEELEARVAERTRELQVANDRLQQLSDTDGLTGLYNRRYFDDVLAREWSRALRQSEPLAVMMLDVDHFKLFNDHFGHQAGDQCLQQLADLLRGQLRRDTDLVARYGGEEFVILMPNTAASSALELGEQIRAAVAAMAVPHCETPAGVITISIGVAVFSKDSPFDDRDALLRAADQALYTSKARGRNRVTPYTTVPVPSFIPP